jgi:hypothetical protein
MVPAVPSAWEGIRHLLTEMAWRRDLRRDLDDPPATVPRVWRQLQSDLHQEHSQFQHDQGVSS